MLVTDNTPHVKLGSVYRTYRPVGKTCPTECPLLNNGCYAQSGPTAIHAKRSADSDGWKEKLLTLPPKSKIRYLVSGDWFIDDQPDWDTISAILEVHAKRPDLRGWSYTHGWRRLDASLFNALPNLTVNASTESEEDALRAVANGWPTVRVVPEDFPKRVETDQVVYLVCPNQTNKAITCDKCQLCLRKDRAINGKPVVVAFRAHGPRKRRVNEMLEG
ncbi:hypothetical protein phiFa_10 [Thermus phage phiFa]|nr:hypothetical protein phiFa_10 [Thermus phage phiFa]